MNIDDMQAGPEIDALIAVEVMGWTKCGGGAPSFQYFRGSGSDIAGIALLTAKAGHLSWSPSTDIAHAWQVVERLRDAGINLSIEPRGLTEREWHVGDCGDSYEGDEWKHAAWNASATLAICRAALKAVRNG